MEAIAMARDYIGIYLVEQECPVSPSETLVANKNQILTFVDVDEEFFKHTIQSKTTKVSVTIPLHLKRLGKAKKINFSKVLTDALEDLLQHGD